MDVLNKYLKRDCRSKRFYLTFCFLFFLNQSIHWLVRKLSGNHENVSLSQRASVSCDVKLIDERLWCWLDVHAVQLMFSVWYERRSVLRFDWTNCRADGEQVIACWASSQESRRFLVKRRPDAADWWRSIQEEAES